MVAVVTVKATTLPAVVRHVNDANPGDWTGFDIVLPGQEKTYYAHSMADLMVDGFRISETQPVGATAFSQIEPVEVTFEKPARRLADAPTDSLWAALLLLDLKERGRDEIIEELNRRCE